MELAVRDGFTPPADLPRGECVVTRVDDPLNGLQLRIDQADPRVLISGKLLDTITIDAPAQVVLDTAGCRPGHGYVGAVLKISAINQQVIYRIVDFVPHVNGYIGQWPD